MPPSSRSRATPCSGLLKLQLSTLKTSQSRPTAPAGSRFGIRRPTRKAKARSRSSARRGCAGYEPGSPRSEPRRVRCSGGVRRGGHAQPERMTARAIRTVIAKRAANAGVEGPHFWTLAEGRIGAVARGGRCVGCRNADGRPVEIAHDAGALLSRPAGSPGRRREAPLRGLTFLERASSCVTSAERSREEESRKFIKAEVLGGLGEPLPCLGVASVDAVTVLVDEG